MKKLVIVAAMAVLVAGCDDTTGPAGASPVAIQFGAAPALASPALAPLGVGGVGVASVAIAGSNGTLTLDEIHVIVDEFELERTEDLDGCEDDTVSGEDDDCEEFDAGPLFMSLDLDSGPTTVATTLVPPGSYDELEFEIEDLEDDEDDDDAGTIEEIRSEIQARFPNWPREASMRVAGSYTANGETEAQPFVAYFEAEVEIELEFDTPFVVAEGEGSRVITVELDPGAWFTHTDGTVRNLAQYDYETTGAVVEFELEMEHGFGSVDYDDDEDDDDSGS